MAAQRKYDWGKWLSEKTTVLEFGKDYHCTQSAMIGMIRNNASQRGIKIHIIDNWLSIVIEVVNAVHHTNTVAVDCQLEPPTLAQTVQDK